MRDEAPARSQLEAVRAAAAGLRWETTAERLIEIYRATCDGAARRRRRSPSAATA